MELSQTSLAMLMFGAMPIGVMLSIVYRLADPITTQRSVFKKIYGNCKDFIFMILAGIMTVILVYYVNDGDYRYLAPLGAVTGFFVSDLLLGKLLVRIRDFVLFTAWRILSVPIRWLWHLTIGPMIAKASLSKMIKSTDDRIEAMMLEASNGFENITEAKA